MCAAHGSSTADGGIAASSCSALTNRARRSPRSVSVSAAAAHWSAPRMTGRVSVPSAVRWALATGAAVADPPRITTAVATRPALLSADSWWCRSSMSPVSNPVASISRTCGVQESPAMSCDRACDDTGVQSGQGGGDLPDAGRQPLCDAVQ